MTRRAWPRRRPQLLDDLAAERARADRAEQQLATVRETPPDVDPGAQAAQIVRLAEAEGRAVREAASRDATALMERTHAEAERHRREVAGQLAARSSEHDRRAAERDAELDEREREIAASAAAERREIERLRSVARAEAEGIRRAAVAEADRIYAAADEALRQAKGQGTL